MYGNYCFWAWLRYWYIDTANYVTMLLLDKGYFDYDYVSLEQKEPVVDWVDTIKSQEELQDMLSGFGIGPNLANRPKTLDEIQKHIIEQESYGGRDSSCR